MKRLTKTSLIKEASEFCKLHSGIYHKDLYGITDGKAIGTYVEHLFKQYLSERYDFGKGNSAKGIDLPHVNTDIKVTSLRQPQSSCPFKDSKQKIFGLGYNLIVFVYNKTDDDTTHRGKLDFVSCSYIDKRRTGDYQTTTGLLKIIENKGNADDVFAFLSERNIPSDDVELYKMAESILQKPPVVGYLTISNALQWRLQYGRIVSLRENIDGIIKIVGS